MRIIILGSGLMGPAAAFNAMSDPEVKQVTMCDVSQARLDACLAALSGLAGAEKLDAVVLDLSDPEGAARALAGGDAVIAALPRPVSALAAQAALRAGLPLVDLSLLAEDQRAQLAAEAEAAGGLVVTGCGLEPGLTEIVTRYLAEKLDRVDEVHIKCGGIPANPTPPLGYKIVFGGRQLPVRERDACIVEDGALQAVPRYSGAEPMTVEGVGECEAWHEGFMPWLLDLPALEGLRLGTQKTVRWPGYAAKMSWLKELGLLSLEPVMVDGVPVAPKRLLDAVLYPRLKMDPAQGDRDITVFRVEVKGERAGHPLRYQCDMVDFYDEALGFTSMARTTAFTGAIVARMIAHGALMPAPGLYSPEKLVTGEAFKRLVDELAAVNIRFKITSEQVETLQLSSTGHQRTPASNPWAT